MADPRRAADRSRIDAALAAAAAAVVADRQGRGPSSRYARRGFGSIAGAPEAAVHEYVEAVRDEDGRVSLRYGAFTAIVFTDGQGRTWSRTQLVAGEAVGFEHDWRDDTPPS